MDSASSSAWRLLADAAAALLALANAHQGLTSPPSRSLPSSPLPSAHSLAWAQNEFLVSKALAARSDAYLAQVRVTFARFLVGRERRALASITAQEIESWLPRSGQAARTRKGHLQYLRALFAFALKRRWVDSNPALAVDLPPPDAAAPGVHTPAQAAAVLAAAWRQHPGVARALAVRYFAGLRSCELERLAPEDWHLERGFVEITAAKSKTRRRRLVKISDNLRAWLAATPEMPGDVEKRITRAWQAAGVPWPHNVTRHSFVSYHLAHHGSAAKTALEAGHSEAMLFAHYREVVTPEAAAAWWRLLPPTA